MSKRRQLSTLQPSTAGSSTTAPKRQRQEQPQEEQQRRRRHDQQLRRHVYLVVDDWERGYSVRKLDVDAFHDEDDDRNADDLDEVAEPLPEPAVARFAGRHGGLWSFGAHGTSILAVAATYGTVANVFPVFDTSTLALTVCPHPEGKYFRCKPWFASTSTSAAGDDDDEDGGGKLYAMMGGTCLTELGAAPHPDSKKKWSWTTTSPAVAPVKSYSVVCSALHPDGRTILVSGNGSTFSLDTDTLSWTCLGNWLMPFRNQAYFDPDLHALVGLCHQKAGRGYVCACDVPPTTATTMPAWKLGKDRLFDEDNDRHLGATLVYLGGDSRYCVIESLVHRDQPRHGPRHRVLYVTTFALRYDKNGELRTMRRRARSYEMIEGHEMNEPCYEPVAFWM